MLRTAVAFEVKDVSQSGPMEFGGYASVFGVIDRTGDIVVAGAFRETLAQFLKDGVIAYQHRRDCPIGKPIDCYEDGHGMFLRAPMADVEMARECHALMREGIVTKLSIGTVALLVYGAG